MTAYRGFIAVISLAIALMRPSLAAAQLSARDGSIVYLPIAVGQKVSVTTADGRKIKGHVLRLSPTTLDIGKRDVPTTSIAITDLTQVKAADSVTNGVVIGALSLGLVGVFWGLYGDTTSDLIDAISGESDGTHYTLTGTLVGASLGAFVGYALDAGKERTVYERGTVGMSVAVRPVISNAGQGISVNIRW